MDEPLSASARTVSAHVPAAGDPPAQGTRGHPVDWDAMAGALLDQVADALVIVDGADRIVHLNAAAVRYLGRPLREIAGRPLLAAFDLPVDTHLARAFREARRTGQPQTWDAPYLPLNIRVLGRVTPLPSGLAAICMRDAHLASPAAESARAAERRSLSILEAIPASIIVLDTENRFLYLNREAEQHLGVPRAVVEGRSWRELGLSVSVPADAPGAGEADPARPRPCTAKPFTTP